MNIAIIAANGRLGQELVKVALESGHSVRAGTRGPSNLKDNDRLTTMACDATNYYDVKTLLKGQDVVFSCIGHVPGSQDDVQTSATKTIVKVMKELHIRRFVTLTGTGARQRGDRITFIDRFLNLGVEIMDKPRIKDGRDHLKVLQKSGLNWTAIRVLKLQFDRDAHFTLLKHGPTLPFVSRKQAARAMLQVVEENTFLRESPIIGR